MYMWKVRNCSRRARSEQKGKETRRMVL